ncbi:MAG: hypothetical protein ACI9F9_002971, partial [Candidatus Paceibacteria bacterium]
MEESLTLVLTGYQGFGNSRAGAVRFVVAPDRGIVDQMSVCIPKDAGCVFEKSLLSGGGFP